MQRSPFDRRIRPPPLARRPLYLFKRITPISFQAFETSATSKGCFRLPGMYKCQLCGDVVAPHTPAFRITMETRARHYPRRHHANSFSNEPPRPRKGKAAPRPMPPRFDVKAALRKGREVDVQGKTVYVDDSGGEGREIVREITVCPYCARQLVSTGGGLHKRE